MQKLFTLFLLFALLLNACGPVTPIPKSGTPTEIAHISPINSDYDVITAENIDKLEQVNALGTGRVYGYAISPDKSKIAIYIHDKIKIYNTETLDEELTINAGKYESQNDLRRNEWSV